MDTVEVDGSSGEGGGSILRLSAALGVIFKKKIHITNIRAKRDNPGLRAQHLVGLEALKALTRGNLQGGTIGSTEILFEPGSVQPGAYNITIGTAGSIGLVYQVLSIACARDDGRKNGKIEVHVMGGGTFGKWAPASSYILHVLIPMLERVGFQSSMVIQRHGFFPKGGASAIITFGGN
nr:RNA 3'-terminal phosphate cyclase [Candidatus Sigynarchaeota archaeon]